MPGAAAVVFADNGSHAALAWVVNTMVTVRELTEAGDEARLVFDGAGALDPRAGQVRPPVAPAVRDAKDRITGAGTFCAGAFAVKEAVEAAGVPLPDEYRRHLSLRKLVAEEFQVLIV